MDGLKIFEENNESKLKIIRKNVYYIISRLIKFGIDTHFLIKDCNIIFKLIKDISNVNNESLIFDNVLLVIQSFSSKNSQNDNIAILIGDHYDKLLDMIQCIKN